METDADFLHEPKTAQTQRSRPGSGVSRTSLKSAIKIYSGLKFFDIKRPSSRSSIKSRGSKVGSLTNKLGPKVINLSRSTSKLGSNISTKLGSRASHKLGSITSRTSSHTSKLQKLPSITAEQKHTEFKSTIDFLFTCDLCSEDDKSISANGFCAECNQYMCTDCLTFHQRVNATKSHAIVIGDDLQKTTKGSELSKSKCATHPGESLKFFCHDHNASICEKCKFIEHAKCENIAIVSDLATGMHNSKEALVILEDIDTVLTEIQHLRQARETDLKEIQSQKEGIINLVSNTRTKVNELLDKIENETLQRFNSAVDVEISVIEKQRETFNNIIPILKAHKDDIANLKEKEADEELFLVTRNAITDIKQYCDVLVEMHKDTYKFNMKFEVSETLRDFYQNLDSLGQVKIKRIKTGATLPSLSFRPHSERVALFAGEVNIYYQTDTVIPSIYKITELPDGGLVLSDTANNKLKLYDHTLKPSCEISLTSEPKGITFLAPSEIMVALNKEKCLQRVFLDQESGLALGRKCFTNLFCIDLISHEREVVALAENKTKFFINLMSPKGQEKRCIRRESKKNGLFTKVMYINRNKDGTKLYVSDSVSGCFVISLRGDVLNHISDNSLDDYRGICINPQGGVYIAGCHSNNVVLFSNEGVKIKDVTDKNLTSPCSVCYSTTRNQLIISYTRANTLKLFTLL